MSPANRVGGTVEGRVGLGQRARSSESVTTSAGGAGEPADGGAVLAARVRGLRKHYRRTVALDGVDLDVPSGAVLGLLGPNGSGKTTLLRLLLGLARPTEGSVQLLGQPMPAAAGRVLPHVGALVDGPGFLPFLSGRDNLSRYAAAEPLLAGAPIADAVRTTLRRVGLDDAASARPCRGYSLGMRQRLGLAAVLLAPRRLVVLDEPTNGLDPSGAREVRRLIAELRAAGTTVLLSSHQLAEVEACCTHVAVLAGGALLVAGELAGLLEADGPALEIATDVPRHALGALRGAGIPGYLERGRVVADLTDTPAEVVVETLVDAGVPIAEARRRRLGLEELFSQLTEEGT